MRYRIIVTLLLIAMVGLCYAMTVDAEQTTAPAAQPANNDDRF